MAAVSINIPLLSGTNFSKWKYRIRSLLEHDQILHVLEDEVPTEVSLKKDFLINDAKAKAIIIQGISDEHLDVITNCNTAKEMMLALQAISMRSCHFAKLTLWRKLMNLKLTVQDSLVDHFKKFETIFHELEELGSKLDESDKMCHLLLSLSKEYDTVVRDLEALPDIKMEFVKARLLGEEIKLKSKINSLRSTVSGEVLKSGSNCFNYGGVEAKKGVGYTKVCTLSAELAAVVGAKQMARLEVVKKIWSLIKEKNLYDPNNRQYVISNDELLKVFGVKRFRIFGMMKFLKNHFID